MLRMLAGLKNLRTTQNDALTRLLRLQPSICDWPRVFAEIDCCFRDFGSRNWHDDDASSFRERASTSLNAATIADASFPTMTTMTCFSRFSAKQPRPRG